MRRRFGARGARRALLVRGSEEPSSRRRGGRAAGHGVPRPRGATRTRARGRNGPCPDPHDVRASRDATHGRLVTHGGLGAGAGRHRLPVDGLGTTRAQRPHRASRPQRDGTRDRSRGPRAVVRGRQSRAVGRGDGCGAPVGGVRTGPRRGCADAGARRPPRGRGHRGARGRRARCADAEPARGDPPRPVPGARGSEDPRDVRPGVRHVGRRSRARRNRRRGGEDPPERDPRGALDRTARLGSHPEALQRPGTGLGAVAGRRRCGGRRRGAHPPASRVPDERSRRAPRDVGHRRSGGVWTRDARSAVGSPVRGRRPRRRDRRRAARVPLLAGQRVPQPQPRGLSVPARRRPTARRDRARAVGMRRDPTAQRTRADRPRVGVGLPRRARSGPHRPPAGVRYRTELLPRVDQRGVQRGGGRQSQRRRVPAIGGASKSVRTTPRRTAVSPTSSSRPVATRRRRTSIGGSSPSTPTTRTAGCAWG